MVPFGYTVASFLLVAEEHLTVPSIKRRTPMETIDRKGMTTFSQLQTRVAQSLLLLRLGVFLVMLMWTLDKLINPAHSAKVFEGFYAIGGVGHGLLMALGILELVLLLLFLGGIWRRFSYGSVLLLHAISTVASFGKYLDPFNNLLFFAAWPMLAACITLYWLRDWDTLGVLGRRGPTETDRAAQ